MRHTMTMRQWVPYPVAQVFDFFADPANLPPLMPAWQHARIDRSTLKPPPTPAGSRTWSRGDAAGAGSRMLISFRAVPFVPLRSQWDARIVEFAWDDHFCDEQASGPFAYWRHCHRLHGETRGEQHGTIVTDEVTFAFPLGVLGEAAYWLGGRAQVRMLFRHRQRQLVRLLAASSINRPPA